MKPSDLSALRIPGAPTLSPDGRHAVVHLTQADLATDEYTGQLWLVSTDGSRAERQLTHGWRDTEPRWSPDGRWLAFLRAEREDPPKVPGPVKVGKPQLWLMPVDGGEARRLTDHPLGAGPAVWSPDSTRLAYVARVPEPGRYGTDDTITPDREPPRRITDLSYRFDGIGFFGDRRAHVWVVDLAGGEPVQVTEGDFDHSDVDWSPDGGLLCFSAARHATARNDLRSDVWICRPDGSGLRALTAGGFTAAQTRFTPDSAGVCFLAIALGPDARAAVCRNTGLWLVPLDGSGPARRLTDQERYTTGRFGGTIVPTGEGVLFPAEHRGRVRLLRVPYPPDRDPEVLVDGECQVSGTAVASGVVACVLADPYSPGEVAVVEAGGPVRTVTSFNADLRDRLGIRPMVELTATAPDGYPVHGWVVRPPGEGPHPVLLMIHGGPFYQYGWQLFDETQVYVGAGYAVVLGNPRGSSGYGEAHGRAVMGNVGELSAIDLLALLDAAQNGDPALDRDRVGVLGGSHGGYMTTWLAAHHGDRFRAGVTERAVNSIDSFTGSSDIGWFFADDLYGPDLDQQVKQSPLAHADRIGIPLLIIHSEHDWRCPVEQAQRLFVALRRRDAKAELLLFPGEGHELSRSGRPRHRVARFEAILDWWARHL
jgi:dipeptidyl aminopeptidase/acylaminoacyl peptidase